MSDDGPHWQACHYAGVARSLDSEATILARRGQWARAIETRTDRDIAWCRALDGLLALLRDPPPRGCDCPACLAGEGEQSCVRRY